MPHNDGNERVGIPSSGGSGDPRTYVPRRDITMSGAISTYHPGYGDLEWYLQSQYSKFDQFNIFEFEQFAAPDGTTYYRASYEIGNDEVYGGRAEILFSNPTGTKFITQPVDKPNMNALQGETGYIARGIIEDVNTLGEGWSGAFEGIMKARSKRGPAKEPEIGPFGREDLASSLIRSGRNLLEKQKVLKALEFAKGVEYLNMDKDSGPIGTVIKTGVTTETAIASFSNSKTGPGLIDLISRGAVGQAQATEYFRNLEALQDPRHAIAGFAESEIFDPSRGDGPDQAAIEVDVEEEKGDPDDPCGHLVAGTQEWIMCRVEYLASGGGGGGTRRIYTPPDEREVADGIRGILATQVGFAVDGRVNDLTRLFMTEDRRAFDNPKLGLSAQASVQEKIRGSEDYKRIHKLRPDYVNENQWVSEMQQRALSAGVGTDFAEQFSVDQATVGADFGSVGQAASTQQFLKQGRAEGEFFDSIRGTVRNMFTGVS